MKWIAKRDFFRTPQLVDIKITEACKGASVTPPHPKHIHMGAIFELGKSENEDELQKSKKDNLETKKLIAMLRYTGCMGDASDKDVVERIELDIETNAKREATRLSLNKEADNAALADAFKNLINLAARKSNAAV